MRQHRPLRYKPYKTKQRIGPLANILPHFISLGAIAVAIISTVFNYKTSKETSLIDHQIDYYQEYLLSERKIKEDLEMVYFENQANDISMYSDDADFFAGALKADSILNQSKVKYYQNLQTIKLFISGNRLNKINDLYKQLEENTMKFRKESINFSVKIRNNDFSDSTNQVVVTFPEDSLNVILDRIYDNLGQINKIIFDDFYKGLN